MKCVNKKPRPDGRGFYYTISYATAASALFPYGPNRVGRRYNQYGVPGLELFLGPY